MSSHKTLKATPSATSSPGSADGAWRSASPAGPTTGPCGPGAARASRSAPRARGAASTTSATSGPSSAASSGSAALQSSLESRLRARLAGRGSTLYALTWKGWDMASELQICALRASAPRTSGNGSGGEGSVDWPTPSTMDNGNSGDAWEERRKKIKEKGINGNGFGLILPMAAQLAGWPTPMAGTPAQAGYNEAGNTDSSRKMVALCGGLVAGHGLRLPEEWSGPARITHLGALQTGCDAGMTGGGQLNPAHSRWLMGFPPAWDACAPTATPSSRRSRRSSSTASGGR